MLITDRDDWPLAEVVAGYRSQSEAEFGFRQLKDPHVVSFSPMHHWTDHNIRVHLFTCVLALQLAHLMRRQTKQAGLDLSVRELLATLAGIGETVLIYPSTGGRPKARRMLTETTPTQKQLISTSSTSTGGPRQLRSYTYPSPKPPATSGNSIHNKGTSETRARAHDVMCRLATRSTHGMGGWTRSWSRPTGAQRANRPGVGVLPPLGLEPRTCRLTAGCSAN